MFKQFLSLAALMFLATACAGGTLITKTAANAGYTDVEQLSEHHTNLGSHRCQDNDVASYGMQGMRDKRLVRFTICCGPDRAGGCEAVENY